MSLGNDHACAVDGTGVVCWGGNSGNKRVVPSLNIVTDNDSDGIDDWREDLLGTEKFVADTDGDGVEDGADQLPLDSTESLDSDGDGIGNSVETDDDNDGIPDALEELSGRDPTKLDYMVSVPALSSAVQWTATEFSAGVTTLSVRLMFRYWLIQYRLQEASSTPVRSMTRVLSVGVESSMARHKRQCCQTQRQSLPVKITAVHWMTMVLPVGVVTRRR